MRGPHRGGEAFAGNVPYSQKRGVTGIKDADQVSREKLRRKYLAGDLVRSAPHASGTTQPAGHLQCIEYFPVERARLLGLKDGRELPFWRRRSRIGNIR